MNDIHDHVKQSMWDRIQWILIQLLPKNTLSRAVGRFAKSRLSRNVIPLYAKKFQIDLSQAEKQIHQYESLTEFFTRTLQPTARPIAHQKNAIVSPVDGTIAQIGTIQSGKLIQAKGVTFTIEELVADPSQLVVYEGGWYVTIYLSPKDYHRIHMPIAGTPMSYSYIPGQLFPVNALGVRNVPGLFARNERIVTYFATELGPMAMVKVGATIVGSVVLEYGPWRTNVKHGKITHQPIELAESFQKGEECARFEFGSTVILLFPPHTSKRNETIHSGQIIQMGQEIGRVTAKIDPS